MMLAHRNIAGRIAETFITSRLTLAFVLGVAMLGGLAVLATPREENPQIVVPAARVIATLPGASPAEIEQLLLRPVEAAIGALAGVDHIDGRAETGLATVDVQFEVGQDRAGALARLHDRVEALQSALPADAGPATVQSIDVDDVPILTLTLASETLDDAALKTLAERLAEGVKSTRNVSAVAVRGGHDRQISVEIDPTRLAAFGLGADRLQTALVAENQAVPLAATVRNGQTEAIRLTAPLTSAGDVGAQILRVSGARSLRLGDVATVTDGPPPEVTSFSRFSFGRADSRFHDTAPGLAAVTVTVAKTRGSNAVRVVDAVLERVARMQAAWMPQEVALVVTRNDGAKADAAVNGLLEHLGIAVAAVGTVLVLFLGWREAAIVMVTVPLILALTLAADLVAGVTINRVTLFALILSLGLLVDAAIVVIENIHRHYAIPCPKGGKELRTIEATNEIGNATNFATLAIMLVFGSLFFVTGMPGDYFYPIAFNVPIAMLASLLVAYIVTPWAANRWLKTADIEATGAGSGHAPGNHGSGGRIERLFLKLLVPLQIRPRLRIGFALAVLGLLLASLTQGGWQFLRPAGPGGPLAPWGVAVGFLPKNNTNTFSILLTLPETAPVETTDRLAREIERLVTQTPEVLNTQAWIGQTGVEDFNTLFKGTSGLVGPWIAEIRVNLIDKSLRDISSIEIVRQLRPQIAAITARWPGTTFRLIEDPPGPPVRATVLAELYGPDAAGLRALSRQVRASFDATWDMIDISDNQPAALAEHRLVPDREKAALSGVSTAQLTDVLALVYSGRTLTRLHLPEERRPVPVQAYVPRRFAVDPTLLDRLFVTGTSGAAVPVSELIARAPLAEVERPITHRDTERVTFVGGELSGSVPLHAVLELKRRLAGIETPDGGRLQIGNLGLTPDAPDTTRGYQLLWGGEIRLTLDTYRDLLAALGAVLVLVYLILVAYYQSFLLPGIAMSAVPLGIIGIFPGHWLMGADFSATSMVGIIALAGVVIRNSMLILDFIQENLRRGLPPEQAIREATAIRLRPILLTMLAIILGSIVMIPDPVFGGLAISLIFGTFASTSLTVFCVPLLFGMSLTRAKPAAPEGGAEAT